MRHLEHIDERALMRRLALGGTTVAPLPALKLAAAATAAWRNALSAPGTPNQRSDRAILAVIRDSYRLGLSAGRPRGAAAVLEHLKDAVLSTTRQLRPGEPAEAVQQILAHLTVAAESQATQQPVNVAELTELPLPRTYLTVLAGVGDRITLEHVAHAAEVGWRHGVEDGWAEAYQTAGQILHPIRESHLATTTTVTGRPMRAWLDDLTTSAYRVAALPSTNPAALARLAGSAPSTTRHHAVADPPLEVVQNDRARHRHTR